MELDTLKRSPRISNEIKELKLKMSDFISTNTKLIAEVKSLKTRGGVINPCFQSLHRHDDASVLMVL